MRLFTHSNHDGFFLSCVNLDLFFCRWTEQTEKEGGKWHIFVIDSKYFMNCFYRGVRLNFETNAFFFTWFALRSVHPPNILWLIFMELVFYGRFIKSECVSLPHFWRCTKKSHCITHTMLGKKKAFYIHSH